ncbi:MAG: hypothetical protein WBP45_13545 [Daejeonella sp.]
MKLIVIYPFESKSSPLVYNSCIKIGYILSDVLVSVGIDEYFYFYKEQMEDASIKLKIESLKMWADPENEKEMEAFLEFERYTKEYNKLKNKSTKLIIAYTKMKKGIDTIFKGLVDNIYEQIRLLGIHEMKKLVNNRDFYFYKDTPDVSDSKTFMATKEDILQLLLPDMETGGAPIFFMSVEGRKDDQLYDIDFLEASDPLAQNLENFYGEESFALPNILRLTNTEVQTVKDELKEATQLFRTKIDEWAWLCYNNPNSTKGLQFFKEELRPLMDSIKEIALQNSIIENKAIYFNHKMGSQLIIGEAPIEKIWDIQFSLNNISREEYDKLLAIKAEQPSKYDGRWPVIFFKYLHYQINETDSTAQAEEPAETILSVRKTLSLD